MSVTNTVTLVFGGSLGHYVTDETSEQWLGDVTVDLNDYGNARFALSLEAAIKATGGTIPTFKVYMQGMISPVEWWTRMPVLTLSPATSPSTWASAMVSAARVVGHGPTTFSLYGSVSANGIVSAGDLISPRYFHVARVLNSGLVLVAGGFDGDVQLATAELFDPATNLFSSTDSMASPRDAHTMTLLNSGKVLVAGGFDGSAKLLAAEIYDPTAATFSPTTGDMAVARSSHTATLLPSGKVLLSGGVDATAELYDPTASTFAATGNMTAARSSHTAIAFPGGKALVAGGYNVANEPLSTAEIYNVATGTFAATGSMTEARGNHCAVRLLTERILIVGNNDPSATAELYDPTSGTFAATGSMTEARGRVTATRLHSGQVLVSGDSGTVDLYDPTSGTFSSTLPSMSAKAFSTATLLAAGGVLFAGGEGGTGDALGDALVYDVIATTRSAEIEAAALTLGFGDTDPAPAQLGPVGGDDIWLDQVTETGDPEYAMTNNGDWASVSGRDAVQQSLMRRFLTKPGDYLVDPSYGAGLLAAVKSRMRQTDLDAIARRIRQQALADRRVRAVSAVTVSALAGTANGLKYSITVDLVADGRPLTVSDEVT